MNYLFYILTISGIKKSQILATKTQMLSFILFFQEVLSQLFITYGNNIAHQTSIVDIQGKK